jgi:hypothetical protein
MITLGGMLERRRAGVGACGETSSHHLSDNWDNNKKIINESRRGLRWPPIDEDTHNNQPEIDRPGGGDTGEDV